MENFTFQSPTKIIFGKDTEQQIGKETVEYLNNNKLNKKILLHYGTGSIKKTGLYDKVIASLTEAGVEFTELSGVVPNPRLSLVKEGIKLCKDNEIEFILAVGGGSAIDSAKAIAAGYYYEGDTWDLFEGKAAVKKALPVATILTLPAAGSEASPASVVTNTNTEDGKDRKLAIRTELIRPVFSILNPELTFSLPDYQTSCGAVDMFAHIVERYFTNTKNVDLTDEMCEAVMRTIIRNSNLALKDPKNYNYRAELMWASTLAHNGLLGTGRQEDWSSHMIEHELSAMYDIAHGAGLAIIIPAWMRFVYMNNLQRFVRFAVNVMEVKPGKYTETIDKLEHKETFDEVNIEETALKGIDAFEEWLKNINMPTRLSEIDINDEKFKEMSELCCGNNEIGGFVKLSKDDIEKIYEIAK
jgi:alcohol dehydrogenase